MLTNNDQHLRSKDELLDLIHLQLLQLAKLPAEAGMLHTKRILCSEFRPEADSVAQPPTIASHRASVVEGAGRSQEFSASQAGVDSQLSFQPVSVTDNKPKWLTKNRLQNCHKPKQK